MEVHQLTDSNAATSDGSRPPKDVSIVLSTWNNAPQLTSTLTRIGECLVPSQLQWEIVVVNNNCTDSTDQIVACFQSKLPLVYVHEPNPGLSHGRNAGLAAASGSLIIFSDDDFRPARGWLQAYWEAFKDRPQGHFFGGSVRSEFEDKIAPAIAEFGPPSVKGVDFGPSARELREDESFIANFACPAEALRQVSGFDTSKGLSATANVVRVGEETDLMRRLRAAGFTPYYVPEATVGHYVPSSKCTTEHIFKRWAASAREAAQRAQSDGSAVQLIGLLLRSACKAAYNGLIWSLSHVVSQPSYRHYGAMTWSLAYANELATSRKRAKK